MGLQATLPSACRAIVADGVNERAWIGNASGRMLLETETLLEHSRRRATPRCPGGRCQGARKRSGRRGAGPALRR